ncbi:hypothetical protein LCGC14_2520940 [marine sediment metagenome]|uniref:Uncharacterized protein n=1 Tax=marine sediment metagenome TaxID=412755 RepID=A0A0F9D7Z0_9ZZZZ
MQKTFPTYEEHKDVKCYVCGKGLNNLHGERRTVVEQGKYYQFCIGCKTHTFYDIERKKGKIIKGKRINSISISKAEEFEPLQDALEKFELKHPKGWITTTFYNHEFKDGALKWNLIAEPAWPPASYPIEYYFDSIKRAIDQINWLLEDDEENNE